VRHFRETASVAKRNPPKRVPSLITPEDIEQVRQAFVTNPRRSASRNIVALKTCNRAVCRILHEDLTFHPHNMVMGHAINDQGTVYRKILCDVLLNALDNDDLNPVLMTGEAKFSSLWQCQFSKLSLLYNQEPSHYSPENFTFLEGYCLV
jgi:hypothetical protein